MRLAALVCVGIALGLSAPGLGRAVAGEIRQPVRSFELHRNPVFSVAVTPDGRRIVSASQDGTVKLWDLATGGLLRSFEGHKGAINAVAVTPDGRRIVSGGADRAIKLWDLETGALLRSFQGHNDYVRSVAVTPDGRRVASAGEDKTVRLWDLESGAPLRTFDGHDRFVASLALTPDGARVVSGGWDTNIRLWDLETGALLLTFKAHRNAILSVAVTPDGKGIVSASWDKTIKLWALPVQGGETAVAEAPPAERPQVQQAVPESRTDDDVPGGPEREAGQKDARADARAAPDSATPAPPAAAAGNDRAGEKSGIDSISGPRQVAGAPGRRGVALVVGINDYPNLDAGSQLRKAANDAETMADTLSALGFEVVLAKKNVGRLEFFRALQQATEKITPDGTVFVFFAGHGVGLNGTNYLLPSDVQPISPDDEDLIEAFAITETSIIEKIRERGAGLVVLALDACRNNPFAEFARRKAADEGRAFRNFPAMREIGVEIRPTRGVFSIYSAGLGQRALDGTGSGENSRNSVFTGVFAKQLRESDDHLAEVMEDVKEEVSRLASTVVDPDTGKPHKQFPAYYNETQGGRVFLKLR